MATNGNSGKADRLRDEASQMFVGDQELNPQKGAGRKTARKGMYGEEELFASREIEADVIQSLLEEPGRISTFIEKELKTDDFSVEAYAEIYEVAESLFEQQEPAQLASLMNRVSEDTGTELLQLMGRPYAQTYWENSLAELLWASDRRKLAKAATTMIGKLWSQHDMTIHEAVSELSLIGRRSEDETRFLTLEDSIPSLQERLTMGRAGLLERMDVPTPFGELNSMLMGGFLPQDLAVLGARPSMGKTGLAMELLLEASNHGTAIMFSGEMSRDLVILRLVSKYAEVPMGRLLDHEVTDEEYSRAMGTMEQLREIPLIIDDTPGITTAQMQLRIQQTQEARGRVSLAAFDYFELIGDGEAVGADKHIRLTGASQRFKNIAKLTGVPMLILTQVNSGTDSRGNKVPSLNDIPWTQTLGQLADKVITMYSHDYYHKRGLAEYDARRAGLMELHVVKNRNGETGQVNIGFDPTTFSFFDLSNASREKDPYSR